MAIHTAIHTYIKLEGSQRGHDDDNDDGNNIDDYVNYDDYDDYDDCDDGNNLANSRWSKR